MIREATVTKVEETSFYIGITVDMTDSIGRYRIIHLDYAYKKDAEAKYGKLKKGTKITIVFDKNSCHEDAYLYLPNPTHADSEGEKEKINIWADMW